MIGYLATMRRLWAIHEGPMARGHQRRRRKSELPTAYCLLPTAHFKTSATSRSARSAPGSKVSGR